MYIVKIHITVPNHLWKNRWKSIKWWTGRTPIDHKFWEIQITKSFDLLCIECDWTARQDHAGASIKIGLLGYEISGSIYDYRHWNTKTNDWNVQ